MCSGMGAFQLARAAAQEAAEAEKRAETADAEGDAGNGADGATADEAAEGGAQPSWRTDEHPYVGKTCEVRAPPGVVLSSI